VSRDGSLRASCRLTSKVDSANGADVGPAGGDNDGREDTGPGLQLQSCLLAFLSSTAAQVHETFDSEKGESGD
jgi:hypothetical protein